MMEYTCAQQDMYQRSPISKYKAVLMVTSNTAIPGTFNILLSSFEEIAVIKIFELIASIWRLRIR